MEPFAVNAKASVGAVRADRVAYFVLPIFFLLYWVVSALVLWWEYSISASIRGGYYEHHQAWVLVTKMGLIITVLTSLAWLLMMRRRRKVWTAVWATAAVLIGYAALILGRLQFSGTPAEDSAFLPILGSINSHFFSEVGWLVFLFYVVPVMGAFQAFCIFFISKFSISLKGRPSRCKIASLTTPTLSIPFFPHLCMHSEKSAISLSLKVLLFQP